MSFPQVFVDFSSLTSSFRRYVPAFRESEGNASRLNWNEIPSDGMQWTGGYSYSRPWPRGAFVSRMRSRMQFLGTVPLCV
jgi:hypothetical protein